MGSIAAEDSLSTESNGGRERIRVSVRLRPLNEDELSRNDPSEWDCISHTTIAFKNTSNAYTFDRVFSSESTTREVYEGGAKDVVMSVVSGINASIFAYGQTSSGKTYTMTGITEMAAADIFDYIEQHEEREFVLKFSAMEIYNESVRDLLSTDSTPLRLLDGPDRSTIVEKLTEEVVRDWEHIMQLLSICEAQREIGETLLNKTSSRSHQIIRLTIESSAREFVNAESSRGLVASVHFVDLAGSERASQAMSAGARLKEGCHINRSLLTLGTVIRKLSKDYVGHIPYRDSKLTRILQQSLGGNARTAIICTMSPARTHMEQSRNTLMFATCAKEVVTRAQVNVVMSDKAMVKHLQRELARLESQLRLPRGDYANELLREREDRIQQMAIDIMEITRQRDVARAQLDDLMRTVGDDQESVHRMEIDIREITRQRDLARAQLDDLMRTAGDDQESVHRFGIFRASASDLPSINGDDFSVDNSSDLLYIGNNNQRSPEISTGHYSNSAASVSSERRDLLSLEVGQEMEDLCKEVQCVAVEETMEVRKGRREWELMERAGSSSSETSGRLGRSRSCKASFMERSPGLLFEEERERTPPGSGFMGEYGRSSRPEDVRRRLFSLRAEVSGEVSSPSASCGFEDRQAQSPPRRVEDTSEDDAQEADEKFSRSVTSRSIKDMGVDPIMITPAESPARWPDEFERRRLEIIELWHLCNISVVHRTYFFLLCLSNPGDPIYLELELRRLRFIKRALSGSNGTKISPSSNVKALRRERGMLCRQMQRRLSAVERETLYRQWGIPLQTKQRKLQLAHLVWTAAGSISHAAESAAVVAKVVGQPNDTHKEMLILSFSLAQSKKTKLSI